MEEIYVVTIDLSQVPRKIYMKSYQETVGIGRFQGVFTELADQFVHSQFVSLTDIVQQAQCMELVGRKIKYERMWFKTN